MHDESGDTILFRDLLKNLKHDGHNIEPKHENGRERNF